MITVLDEVVHVLLQLAIAVHVLSAVALAPLLGELVVALTLGVLVTSLVQSRNATILLVLVE